MGENRVDSYNREVKIRYCQWFFTRWSKITANWILNDFVRLCHENHISLEEGMKRIPPDHMEEFISMLPLGEYPDSAELLKALSAEE